MLRCPCTIVIILICGVIALYKSEYTNNVGTVLFSNSDLKKTEWNTSEIGLLKARRYFQSLLPPPVFLSSLNENYVDLLFSYFREAYASIKRETNDPDLDRLMTTALSDSIGGYLKTWVLPITKFAFYGGTISEQNVTRLFEFYDEIKSYLSTDGEEWNKPKTHLFDVAIRASNLKVMPPKLKLGEDPCDHFVFFEKTPEGLTVPIPHVTWDGASSRLFIPLKNHSIYSMNSMNSTSVLLRYYDIAKYCLQKRYPNMLSNFETRFQTWLTKEVLPHLEDENVYFALGSVLTVINGSREVSETIAIYSKPKNCTQKPYKQWLILFNFSKKTMILFLLFFIEVIWCCVALFYTCYRKRKKNSVNNVYLLVNSSKESSRVNFSTQEESGRKSFGINICKKISKGTGGNSDSCSKNSCSKQSNISNIQCKYGIVIDPCVKQTSSAFKQTSRCSSSTCTDPCVIHNDPCRRQTGPTYINIGTLDRGSHPCCKQNDPCCRQSLPFGKRTDKFGEQTKPCCSLIEPHDRNTNPTLTLCRHISSRNKNIETRSKQIKPSVRQIDPSRTKTATRGKKSKPTDSQVNPIDKKTDTRGKNKKPSGSQIEPSDKMNDTVSKQTKACDNQIDPCYIKSDTRDNQIDPCYIKSDTRDKQSKPYGSGIAPCGRKSVPCGKHTIETRGKLIVPCGCQIGPSSMETDSYRQTIQPCSKHIESSAEQAESGVTQTNPYLLLAEEQSCPPKSRCQQPYTSHTTSFVSTEPTAILTKTNSNSSTHLQKHRKRKSKRHSTQSNTVSEEYPYSIDTNDSNRIDTIINVDETSSCEKNRPVHQRHEKQTDKISAYTKMVANVNKECEIKENSYNETGIRKSRKDFAIASGGTEEALFASQYVLGKNDVDIQVMKSKASINLSQIKFDTKSESLEPIDFLKSDHLIYATETQIMQLPLSESLNTDLATSTTMMQVHDVEHAESQCIEEITKASTNSISKSVAKSVSFYNNESIPYNIIDKECEAIVIDMEDIKTETPTVKIEVRTDKPKQKLKIPKGKTPAKLTNILEASKKSIHREVYAKTDEVISRNENITYASQQMPEKEVRLLDQTVSTSGAAKKTDTHISIKMDDKDEKLQPFKEEILPSYPLPTVTKGKVQKNVDTDVKNTRLSIQKECKGKEIDCPKKPYWEITIDEPQKDVYVGIKGTLKMDSKTLKRSKIPKLSVKTILEPLSPSSSCKAKSQIPQLTRKVVDDLEINVDKEKDKLNTSI